MEGDVLRGVQGMRHGCAGVASLACQGQVQGCVRSSEGFLRGGCGVDRVRWR